MFKLIFALIFILPLVGQEIDPALMKRIEIEASKPELMNNARILTDRYGPRLSYSPQLRDAGQWLLGTIRDFGVRAQVEYYRPSGRYWTSENFHVAITGPAPVVYQALQAVPTPWTESTHGLIQAAAVHISTPTSRDRNQVPEIRQKFFESFPKGSVKGKIVLLDPPVYQGPPTEGASKRLSDAELAQLATKPAACPPLKTEPGIPNFPQDQFLARCVYDNLGSEGMNAVMQWDRKMRVQLREFLRSQGALATVGVRAGQTGLFSPADGDLVKTGDVVPLPGITIEPEHYNRICRLLDAKEEVWLELQSDSEMSYADISLFNVIAEIRGTKKPLEVVMLGAHLDSANHATGATDNAAGSLVVLEALRILKAVNFKPDRTIRFAFWTGEEEGLLGSRAYVEKHLSAEDDRENFRGYFNIDNGSGKIRGVIMHPNDPEPTHTILNRWLEPFVRLEAATVGYNYYESSDVRPFQEAGLPAFEFLQDPLDYWRGWHTNWDTYERLSPEDLRQAVVVAASIIAEAANANEKLPRQSLLRK